MSGLTDWLRRQPRPALPSESRVYPPGVGYVPGRGPHGPAPADSEYAGKCYCGYPPAECDAYAEALSLYGHELVSEPDEHGALARELNRVAEAKAALAHDLELIRRALLGTGLFDSVTLEVVAGVQHLAAELDRRRGQARQADDGKREGAAEIARLTSALEAFQARVSRTPTADLERERAANAALSDRLAELHAERDRLERRVFELEGRATPPNLIVGQLL